MSVATSTVQLNSKREIIVIIDKCRHNSNWYLALSVKIGSEAIIRRCLSKGHR